MSLDFVHHSHFATIYKAMFSWFITFSKEIIMAHGGRYTTISSKFEHVFIAYKIMFFRLSHRARKQSYRCVGTPQYLLILHMFLQPTK